jgi:amino acid adenylation domain-containing protein
MSRPLGGELLHDYLASSARRWPTKEALVCGDARYTYTDLDARAEALAAELGRRGVARGDRVLILEENSMEAVVSFWAALKAGAVASIISPQTRPDKLAYMLADCTPAAVVAASALRHVFEGPLASAPHVRVLIVSGESPQEVAVRAPRDVPREAWGAWAEREGWAEAPAGGQRGRARPGGPLDIDLAAIIYTSGSTGKPKGVMLTHRNMLTAAASLSAYLGITEHDVILSALPISFDYGLYQMIMAFRAGARLVLERGFVYPARVLDQLQRERATVFPGVPTMFAVLGEQRALAAAHDLSSVRAVTNTAAALPTKHIGVIKEVFPGASIFSMYGLTECKRVSYLPPEDIDRKPSSVGVAIPNTELWIEVDGRRVGPGVVGELVVRGATVMAGYWGDPDATARRLHPGPLPGERVLHTGDHCYLDDEGYLYFVARMDDIIKCRGEKVAPREVEEAIVDVPGVKECAVIGVPDPLLGQAVKAFVVVEQGAALTHEEIRRACQRRLEPFKVPSQIALVAALPRTSTGKISRQGLA